MQLQLPMQCKCHLAIGAQSCVRFGCGLRDTTSAGCGGDRNPPSNAAPQEVRDPRFRLPVALVVVAAVANHPQKVWHALRSG
jgi:hypothetical protein